MIKAPETKPRNAALLSASLLAPFPVNQNIDIKAMSVTKDEVGEVRPPG